jgi:hypothetical protein
MESGKNHLNKVHKMDSNIEHRDTLTLRMYCLNNDLVGDRSFGLYGKIH